MAKRQESKTRHLAAGPRGAAARRREAIQSTARPTEMDFEGEQPSGRERMAGGRGTGRRQTEGLREGVGEVAQNVVASTKGAAEATMGAARDLATGAAGAASSMASKVRENPWPSLLIGAGATWLAIDAVRGRSGETRDLPFEAKGTSGASATAGAGGTERGAVGQAMAKVAQVGRAAGEQIEEFVRERPLLAGAATLGLGVAVGMALPASVTENRMLGEARDNVVRRAREAAQETMQKVRDVSESFERIAPFGSSEQGAAEAERGASARRPPSGRGGPSERG